MAFTFELAAKSDVGAVRANNEDTFLCDCDRNLYVVCDGMGGEEAGEVASHLAAEVIARVVSRGVVDNARDFPAGMSDTGKLLMTALDAANTAIYLAAEHSPQCRGMGTTASALMLRDGIATVAHVGDSRVYLLRNRGIEQLTRDHSVVAEQVRAGVIAPENARHSPMVHYLTRALGPHATVETDVTETFVEDGDMFLLATDGLVDTIDDELILSLASSAPDHEQCVSELIETAKRSGSTDNITCVLVKACATQAVEQASGPDTLSAGAH
jgi:protein phosphatase